MRDFFLQGTTGNHSRVPISEAEFRAVQQARGILHHFLSITETYRVVVESYRGVELSKHNAELDSILSSKFAYRSSLDTRVLLNCAIVSYLSSTRLFLDSTDRLLQIVLDEASVNKYQEIKKVLYDGSAEYRFIEALRNYVQHKALPVHHLTYHGFVEDKADIPNSDLVTALSIRANRESLRKDGKFKTAALEGLPELIDIIEALRLHMEGMWRLHEHILEHHADVAKEARARIEECIQRFVTQTGESALGLQAIACGKDSEEQEVVHLVLEWDDARIAAIKELGNLSKLHRSYISGKIQKT